MKSVTALIVLMSLMLSPIPQASGRRVTKAPGRSPVPQNSEEAGLPEGQRSAPPSDATWVHLQKLAPGTEIILTTRSSPAGKRYLLAVDDSALVVLNLTPPLPPAAKAALRKMASSHPEYLAYRQASRTFVLERNVRIEAGRLFVADESFGDLGQMVERITRAELVNVHTPGLSRGASIVIGTAVAAAIAVVVFLFRARYCNEHRC